MVASRGLHLQSKRGTSVSYRPLHKRSGDLILSSTRATTASDIYQEKLRAASRGEVVAVVKRPGERKPVWHTCKIGYQYPTVCV